MEAGVFDAFTTEGAFEVATQNEGVNTNFGLSMGSIDAITPLPGAFLPLESSEGTTSQFVGADPTHSGEPSAVNEHDPHFAGQAQDSPFECFQTFSPTGGQHMLITGQPTPGISPVEPQQVNNETRDLQDIWTSQSHSAYTTDLLRAATDFAQFEPHSHLGGPTPPTLSTPITPVAENPFAPQWQRHLSDPTQQASAHQSFIAAPGLASNSFNDPFNHRATLPSTSLNLAANEQHTSQWTNNNLQGSSHAQYLFHTENTPATNLKYPSLPFRHSMPSFPTNGLVPSSHAIRREVARVTNVMVNEKYKTGDDDGRSRENRKRRSEMVQTEEEKRDVFLQRNRQAAAKCRNKKKARDAKTLSVKKLLVQHNEWLHLQREELVEEVMRMKSKLLGDVASHDCCNETVKKWVAYTTSERGKLDFKKMIADPSDDPKLKERKLRLAKLVSSFEMEAEFEAELADETQHQDSSESV